MTKDEALNLLETAPMSSKLSRVNPVFTQEQSVDMIRKGIETLKPGKISTLFEKRVWQVVKDQKHPRY